MYVKEVTVENQVGLHARPATFFIQKANEYKSSIWVEKEERRVNAKSLLGVLSLGIVGGTTIRIIADGADEQAAVDGLVKLVGSGFASNLFSKNWWGDPAAFSFLMAIPHNSKCRYGERGAAAAKPKAQIILCVLSSILATQICRAASPERCLSRKAGIVRCCLTRTPTKEASMTKAELYKKACMLPLLPGVYIIRDKTDTIIYIGKAKRLKIRVSQYFREGVPHDAKVTQMINHAFTFDVIVCQSEFEALVLEASQIKAHTPKYNILLKDDKGYSYVKITRGPWPRVSAALQKDDDDADYIGPFTSSFAVREMVEMAQDCFLLPRCSKEFPRDFGKGRPCLNAHIGKCMAVCSGKITCEAYNDAVQGALRMVRYGKKDIVKQLREKMEAASDRLDFETAALLRDQIQAIERVAAGQKVVMDADTEMDIIALAGTTRAVCAAVLRYRDGRLTDKREFMFHDTTNIDAVREEFLPQYYLNGETVPKMIAVDALPPDAEALNEALAQARGTKVELYVPQRGDVAKLVTMAYTNAVERLGRESGRYTREQKLLEEAAQVLGLKAPPRVIESYDISNWGDGSSVCGMVVFMDGKPHRSGYRRFKMKTVAGTDDYASLAETLSRRAAEYEAARRGEKPDGPQNQFATLPDLLLIDGGKGQVGAVKQALRGTALEHVPTFGMVKDDHHRTRAIVDDEGGEIAINRNRNIFTFVTNIQDETHRYANDYRKRAMKKKSYAATLTAIPGVGEKTSAALLAHFKTVAAVKAASISDLEEVKGISHAKAEMLYNALRNGV